MLSAHLRKLRQRTSISAGEQRAIEGLVSEVRTVRADQAIIRAGEKLNSSVLLLDGWTARTSDLASGGRQISELHIAGDFIDLHGFTLKMLDHDLRTFTPCRLAMVPHERLEQMLEKHPRLARIYWFSTNVDAAIHRAWVLSLGQRSALSHMAHLFLELYLRLDNVGLVEDGGYAFPLTQREIAECLGLTTVHANRTVQELRRRGLIVFADRRARILDRRGLEALAEFDPRFLYLDKREF